MRKKALRVFLILLFLLLQQQCSSKVVKEADFLALLAIKHALVDSKGVLKSWNESNREGLCSGLWAGVKCSKGKVIALNLPGKSLGGLLAPETARLLSLRKLNLHSNLISGPIPASLASLPHLRALYLFRNRFVGTLPKNFISTSSDLLAIDLSHNSLSGSIPTNLALSPHLARIDLSFNRFNGHIPPLIISSFPKLTYLNLSHNQLLGNLPALEHLNELETLDLSYNFLSGSIPTDLTLSPSIACIDLSFNRFNGRIPPSMISSFPGLTYFNLGHNQLLGNIPTLEYLTKLEMLDFSHNSLSGSIPTTLARSMNLTRIDLSVNRFNGYIPPSLGSSFPRLTYLNLSHNQLLGDIPTPLGYLAKLEMLDLSTNSFGGTIPHSLTNLSSLIVLVLSNTNLSGPLPNDIDKLASLQLIDVSGCSFSGELPPTLGRIAGLSTLDVSRNDLSGFFPSSLASLVNLSSFNCSGNRLIGPVPLSLSKRFHANSFLDNPGLCNFTLDTPCASDQPLATTPSPLPTSSHSKVHGFRKLSLILIISASVVVGFLSVCLMSTLLWRCCSRKGGSASKKGEQSPSGDVTTDGGGGHLPSGGPGVKEGVGGKLVHFEGSLGFSAEDLLCATAEVLGKSSYGTVYKATLEDAHQLAVKRLREGIVRNQKEFEDEMSIIGGIRHPNLISLRAYYWGPKGEKLLVQDFMPGGSLAAFLHARGPDTPMTWQTRMNIAARVSQGLAYLHQHEHKLVHGNLTSTNVLLDSHMNAVLSDFGLARLMTAAANSGAMAVGYRAPEAAKTRKATPKSDVYSFGIILLELLTGKAPGDAPVDLPEWVASMTTKGEWNSEVFDAEVLRGSSPPPSREVLMNMLQLAMACVNTSPSNRPDMADVAPYLEELFQK